MRVFLLGLVALAGLLRSEEAQAAEARVAVASNFVAPMQALADAFSKKTGHQVVVASGATGKLYAQIKNGAPFDALFAADEKAPAALETEGLAVQGSRFTYAIGKLALYSSKPNYVDSAGKVLQAGKFQHLAVANPKLAPYGAAAMAVLGKLGLTTAITPKLVEGENIAQTLQFVVSGNAELGFVAWSQLLEAGKPRAGSFWLVPEELYPPIRQDAVLLHRGAHNDAAGALIDFVKTEAARGLIVRYGYAVTARAASPDATRK